MVATHDGGIERAQLLRRVVGSPWCAATATLAAYSLWLLAALWTGHDARDFILIGRKFLLQSHVSQSIKLDPKYHYLKNNVGYDGQFAYYIALDPVNARYYLDTHGKHNADPDYRYTRIVYPMLARALALGRAHLIPYALVLINVLAAAAGVLALGIWLRRRGISPWFAQIFGLYPGIFLAVERDLNEVLAFALVAWGVLALDLQPRRRLPAAGIAFALAALTRETTAVFPLLYGCSMLLSAADRGRGNSRAASRRDGLMLLAISLIPLALYKLFLIHWLNTAGRAGGGYPTVLPFAGILAYWPWAGAQIDEVVGVVAPALVCGWVALRAIRRARASLETWALIANTGLFVVFLNPYNYINIAGSGRVTAGVVLSAVCCIPAFDAVTGGGRRWLWIASALWFFSLPALNPLWHRRVGALDLLLVPTVLGSIWLLSQLPAARNRSQDLSPATA